MKQNIRKLRRIVYVLTAVAAVGVFSLPGLVRQVSAAQATTRSIVLSNSTPSATGVTYSLTFTPVTTAQELIVDFCGDTPFIGSTCAFAATTVPNVASVTSSAGTASTVGSGTPLHTVKVTGLTMTGGTPFNITFGGIVNPSTATSFYARILTFGTGNASGYVPANTTGGTTTTGTYVDYGGDAMSTAQAISVTAKVMESLTFCVSGATITTCGTTTTPTLTLGHGTNTILDATAVDTANAYTQASTNAQSGIVVRLKNTSSATCGGLSSNGGTSCGIPAVASGATTATTIAAGTAAFGMCVTPGSANTTATLPYNNVGCTKYGMDDSSGTSVRSTYGSSVFSTTGPVNGENDTLTFGATAGNTTPAGIYSATMALVASGTF